MTDESSSSSRTESIWVLYGSQTGNSEQAAKDFCQQIETKFTPSYFKGLDLDLDPTVKVETTCMQLDDFLEYQHAAFTKTMVIFVSSYGVGQAPLGSPMFRSFAEELLVRVENGKTSSDLLKGLDYAICGLGDSNYTTYLDNPTTITMALKAVGANELIKMGEADASQIGDGETSQRNTIIKWKEELWIPLAKAVATAEDKDNDESSVVDVDVKNMQKGSIPILMKIDPDYTPPKEFGGRAGGAIPMHLLVVAVIVALIAALFLTGVIEAP